MKKILIIEDEAEVKELIKKKLESSGYGVITTDDGQEGLDIMQNQDLDLIITDVAMPKMDGETFVRKIRQGREYLPTPVIVMTAWSSRKQLFETLGVNTFLLKPFNVHDLLSTIEQVFKFSQKKLTQIRKSQAPVQVLLEVPHKNGFQAITNQINSLSRWCIQTDTLESHQKLTTQILNLNPDIIVLEVLNPNISCIESVKIIRSYQPHTPIVLYKTPVSTSADPLLDEQLKSLVKASIAAGASGYVEQLTQLTLLMALCENS